MPQQFRGFEIGPIIDQFMQMQRYKEFIDERKRQETTREAEQGPGALSKVLTEHQRSREEYGLNPSSEDVTSLLESIMARQQVRPEYRGQIRDIVGRAPSLATERRKQDFRNSLAIMGETFAKQNKENAALSAQVEKDPQMKAIFGGLVDQFNAQRQERLQMYQNLIGLQYQDLMGDPEIRDQMNNVLLQVILGGQIGTTSPVQPPGTPGGGIQGPALGPGPSPTSLLGRMPGIIRTPDGGMRAAPR